MTQTKSRKELTRDEADFWRLVRLRATSAGVGQPYIAPAIFRLVPISSPGLGTMGVDKFWRVYVDFEFMMEKGVEYAAGVLAHEPWHLLRDHNRRAEEHGAKHSFVWNMAGDLEINDDIINLVPKDSLFPGKGHFADYSVGDVAENYYDKIIASMPKEPQPKGDGEPQDGEGEGEPQDGEGEGEPQDGEGQGKSKNGQGNGLPQPNCGSGSGGDKFEEYELEKEDADSVDGDEHDSIKKQVAEEIKRAEGNKPGSTPAWVKAWADEVTAHKPVSWRQVLRGQVKSAISWKRGQTDYVKSRPARRQPVKDVIFPALRSPRPRIMIGVDTSGSNLHNLGIVLKEVGAIAKQVGVRGEEMLVFSVDTERKGTKFHKFSDVKDVEFIGGGGTRMEAFYETVDANSNKADVFILLTDGECSWNYKPRSNGKFITCIIADKESAYGEKCYQNATEAISAWSKVIKIEVESRQ